MDCVWVPFSGVFEKQNQWLFLTEEPHIIFYIVYT